MVGLPTCIPQDAIPINLKQRYLPLSLYTHFIDLRPVITDEIIATGVLLICGYNHSLTATTIVAYM